MTVAYPWKRPQRSDNDASDGPTEWVTFTVEGVEFMVAVTCSQAHPTFAAVLHAGTTSPSYQVESHLREDHKPPEAR